MHCSTPEAENLNSRVKNFAAAREGPLLRLAQSLFFLPDSIPHELFLADMSKANGSNARATGPEYKRCYNFAAKCTDVRNYWYKRDSSTIGINIARAQGELLVWNKGKFLQRRLRVCCGQFS